MHHKDNEAVAFRGDWFFLSNFYPCQVHYDGRTYRNSEAAFQAAKFTNLTEAMYKEFCEADASTAKRLGRTYGPLRSDWETVKNDIMWNVLRAKFRDPELRNLLLNTDDDHLEETNNWGDRYWGTVDGQGLNTLGVMLMELRHQLRDDGVRAYEVLKRLVLHMEGSWFKWAPTLDNLEAVAEEIIECSGSIPECMPVWKRITRTKLLEQLTPFLRHDPKCDYFSDKEDPRCTCGLDEVIKNAEKESPLDGSR